MRARLSARGAWEEKDNMKKQLAKLTNEAIKITTDIGVYVAYRRASFVYNEKMHNMLTATPDAKGVIIAIAPSSNGSNYEEGYYLIPLSDAKDLLWEKTQLDCWINKKEWSQSKPPAAFSKYFHKY